MVVATGALKALVPDETLADLSISQVAQRKCAQLVCNSISGLVVEYIVAIDVTRVRFPADALLVPAS